VFTKRTRVSQQTGRAQLLTGQGLVRFGDRPKP